MLACEAEEMALMWTEFQQAKERVGNFHQSQAVRRRTSSKRPCQSITPSTSALSVASASAEAAVSTSSSPSATLVNQELRDELDHIHTMIEESLASKRWNYLNLSRIFRFFNQYAGTRPGTTASALVPQLVEVGGLAALSKWFGVETRSFVLEMLLDVFHNLELPLHILKQVR